MQQDGGWPPDGGPPVEGEGSRRPRTVDTAPGPVGGPPPEVRLRREYKGPTVRDLLTDDRLTEQLPGRVRTALKHLERGDLAAADAALPGHFGAILTGPVGAAARRRRRLVRWITAGVLATAAATATIWFL